MHRAARWHCGRQLCAHAVWWERRAAEPGDVGSSGGVRSGTKTAGSVEQRMYPDLFDLSEFTRALLREERRWFAAGRHAGCGAGWGTRDESEVMKRSDHESTALCARRRRRPGA